jgi:hypothetical protein
MTVNAKSYIVRSDHRKDDALCVARGDIVERSHDPDYGCAAADSRRTGIRHLTVRHANAAQGPWFTIPFSKLKRIPVE